MGWEKHGESTNFAYPGVLRFRDGQVYNLRTISDELPTPVWYHSCKDATGNFVKVRCVRKETGACALCDANNSLEYAKADKNEKPAPLKVEFVWPVWVTETSQLMLLVGKQVWDRIAQYGAEYGTLADARLKVTRTNASGKIEYTVTPFKGEPPLRLPPGTQMPNVQGYIDWLGKNIDRVSWLKPGGAAQATLPVQPSFAPVAVPQSGQTAPATFGPVQITMAPGTPPPAQPVYAPPVQPAPQFVQPGTAAPQFVQPGTVAPQFVAPGAAPQFVQSAAPVAAQPTFAQPAAPAGDAQACAALRSRFLTLTKVWFDPAFAEQVVNKYGPGIQMENKTLEQMQGIIAEYEAQIRAQGKAVPA